MPTPLEKISIHVQERLPNAFKPVYTESGRRARRLLEPGIFTVFLGFDTKPRSPKLAACGSRGDRPNVMTIFPVRPKASPPDASASKKVSHQYPLILFAQSLTRKSPKRSYRSRIPPLQRA